jgi:hypothetical protein
MIALLPKIEGQVVDTFPWLTMLTLGWYAPESHRHGGQCILWWGMGMTLCCSRIGNDEGKNFSVFYQCTSLSDANVSIEAPSYLWLVYRDLQIL